MSACVRSYLRKSCASRETIAVTRGEIGALQAERVHELLREVVGEGQESREVASGDTIRMLLRDLVDAAAPIGRGHHRQLAGAVVGDRQRVFLRAGDSLLDENALRLATSVVELEERLRRLTCLGRACDRLHAARLGEAAGEDLGFQNDGKADLGRRRARPPRASRPMRSAGSGCRAWPEPVSPRIRRNAWALL